MNIRSAIFRPIAVGVLAGALGFGTALSAEADSHGHGHHPTARPTIVLVHGAFADASSWESVVARLQHEGYRVIAPANPLRGLHQDSSYLVSFLKSLGDTEIILGGHSYGGEVITEAASDPDVKPHIKALVYIAAIAPEVGESAGSILAAFPGSELTPENQNAVPYTRPDGSTGTDLYIKPEAFRPVFAGDLPQEKTDVMAATQRPIDQSALGDTADSAAWKDIPSWYLVACGDKTIPPAAEQFMAERANSTTVSVNSSHAAPVSHPEEVTNLILDAASS
ncbi:alpha/beta hydrolase [Kitasatospora sp. NPDC048540]|uniref:alpha/beta fold hydrolase n=1 Tax=unclassified Kitasatospora TaxID=2633591 RepID=UPI00053A1AC6|nr:alpha/beta hydrolase [Kitasatospora sp. MBT63]